MSSTVSSNLQCDYKKLSTFNDICKANETMNRCLKKLNEISRDGDTIKNRDDDDYRNFDNGKDDNGEDKLDSCTPLMSNIKKWDNDDDDNDDGRCNHTDWVIENLDEDVRELEALIDMS